MGKRTIIRELYFLVAGGGAIMDKANDYVSIPVSLTLTLGLIVFVLT